MLKKISSVLLICIFLIANLPFVKSSASINKKELKVTAKLTNWILDNPNNTLYAISESDKKLLFINATNLTVDKTLALPGAPTDIIIDGSNLYISLPTINKIVVVDIKTKTLSKTLSTKSDCYRIVKDGENIFYTEYNQWCNIYKYNLTENIDSIFIANNFYNPDIAINTKDHILYVGESGITGADLDYYSTVNGELKSTSNYDGGYGFSSSSRSVIYDESKLYYAGRSFDALDANKIDGDFNIDGDRNFDKIISVSENLVFTTEGIYDKKTYRNVGDYGAEVSLVAASDYAIYNYDAATNVIRMYNNTAEKVDASNVISLIGGVATRPVQATEKSTKLNSAIAALKLESKLDNWILDENNNSIYAVSAIDKAIFFIDSTTIDIEKSIVLPSSPTDIIQDGNYIYIALDNTNKIVVIDAVKQEIINTIYTKSDPYRIVKYKDNIYYTERDQWCKIYRYNLLNNTDVALNIDTFYEPDLAINKEDGILYIAESVSSSSDLLYYDLETESIISQTAEGFEYSQRNIIFDGERVYFNGYDFNKNTCDILGQYGEEIIFAKYGLAYSKTNVYDTSDYSYVSTGEDSFDLYENSSKQEIYTYSSIDSTLIRVDATKMHKVKFDSQGGNVLSDLVAYEDELILEPQTPTKADYIFGGWYKEAKCINAWSFSKDIVSGDTVLYAKWIEASNDVNGDGVVTVLDTAYIGMYYGTVENETEWNSKCDLNKDGVVDVFDFVILSKVQ